MSDVAPVDICNLALSIIGGEAEATVPYLDTLDGSPADPSAQFAMGWCQKLYPRARDYSEQTHNWPECLRFKDPGAVLAAADAEVAPGWTYWFTKPAECLAMRGVIDADYVDPYTGKYKRYPYIEIGNQIGCNYTAILLKYLWRLEDCSKMSEPLITVIAHRLAYYLARPMGLNANQKQQLLKEYGVALMAARGDCQKRVYVSDEEGQIADRAHQTTPTFLDRCCYPGDL